MPDQIYGTNFLESEAVLAMSAEDPDYAKQKLRAMSSIELLTFGRQLRALAAMCDAVRYVKLKVERDA